ncbi:hypothetical protein PSI15_14485 [Xenorhabdus sp. PR6a]|uniref:hypothetical protein n=1 Tax=Xenorhabdus sp. PR6a TaxID=3025877 RepID=UPI002359D05E|nr:hypothetical protein [Xenorhabdus sp. PR6a]MDC9582757.1 hypothetical protein [Xenorhabdus sp. PR6a]
MIYLIILLCGLLVMIISLYVLYSNEAKTADLVRKKIADSVGVPRCYISDDNSVAIAFDSKGKRLAIAKGIIRKKISVSTIDYSDIVGVELKEGDVTIANSVTTNNALLRGVTGFAIAGGVGAILGGLSSKSKTTTVSMNKINSLGVDIYIKNSSYPIIRFKTFRSQNAIDKDGYRYNKELDRVTRLYGKIKRAIEESNPDTEQPPLN